MTWLPSDFRVLMIVNPIINTLAHSWFCFKCVYLNAFSIKATLTSFKWATACDYVLVHSWAFFLLADINLNSPNKGLMVEHSDILSDVPVGGAMGNSATPLPPGLMEEEAEELCSELSKVWGLVTQNYHWWQFWSISTTCQCKVCFLITSCHYIYTLLPYLFDTLAHRDVKRDGEPVHVNMIWLIIWSGVTFCSISCLSKKEALAWKYTGSFWLSVAGSFPLFWCPCRAIEAVVLHEHLEDSPAKAFIFLGLFLGN